MKFKNYAEPSSETELQVNTRAKLDVYGIGLSRHFIRECYGG